MDMTLREGRQVSGVSVRLDEVLELARRLDEVGVHIVEMHHDLIDEIRGVKKMGARFKIQGLIHPTAALNPAQCREEIDILVDAGTDIICPAFAISDYNYQLVESMGGLKISRAEALDRACEAVQFGKEKGAFINPNLMDITRLDLDWLLTIVRRLKEAGIDMLRVDDICAPCLPAVIKHHVVEIMKILGDIPLAILTHDDFNLGIAGQLAALEGGAEVLEGTINGLGERAGVPNLAVLTAILEIMYGYDTGIKLDKMQDLAEWVADVWNQPIPDHRQGTGRPPSPTRPRCTTSCPRVTSGRSTPGPPGSSEPRATSPCATTPGRPRSSGKSTISACRRSTMPPQTASCSGCAPPCACGVGSLVIATSPAWSKKSAGKPGAQAIRRTARGKEHPWGL
jgi:isopropylmalate/homocitrate/citramalate synthase